jgi:hypothetical protein
MNYSQLDRLIKLYETLGQSGTMTLNDASETLKALRDYKTLLLQIALTEQKNNLKAMNEAM